MLRFFKSIFKHKHQWAVIADTYFESDTGVGMEPVKHSQVKCQKCGAMAAKTDHPMYGTKITEVPGVTNSYSPFTAHKILSTKVIYKPFKNPVAQ